jgi:hypothetical protein
MISFMGSSLRDGNPLESSAVDLDMPRLWLGIQEFGGDDFGLSIWLRSSAWPSCCNFINDSSINIVAPYAIPA